MPPERSDAQGAHTPGAGEAAAKRATAVPYSARGRALRWGSRVLIFVVVTVVLLASAVLILRSYYQGRLQDELDRIPADQPLTLADVRQTYHEPVPDDENAAELWKQVIEEMTASGAIVEGSYDGPIHPEASDLEPNDPEDSAGSSAHWAELKLFLAKQRHVFPLIDAALAKPQTRFAWDATADPLRQFSASEPLALRFVTELLRSRVHSAVHEGDAEAAISVSLQLCELPRHCPDHTLIAHFVGLALHHAALDSVECTLQLDLAEAQLRELAFGVGNLEMKSMVPALCGERAYAHAIFTDDQESGGAAVNLRRPGTWGRWLGSASRNHAAYLSGLRHYIAALQAPPVAARQEFAKIDATIKEGLSGWLGDPFAALAMGPLFDRNLQQRAAQSAAQAAIAVELARDHEGRPPTQLPIATVDPFTGTPLRYRPTLGDDGLPDGMGYLIYSVGRNGIDEGGDEETDVVFTVRAPVPDDQVGD